MSESLALGLEVMERKLRLSLEQARAHFAHPGIRGSGVEDAVRKFFSDHLPRRLNVGHGEILDRGARRSAQTDLVITNEDQPLIYPLEQAGIFLIEGVAAAAEVKSKLTTNELDDVIRKGRRYRKLRVSHLPGDQIFSSPEKQEWFFCSPPFFCIAIENDVSHQTIIDRLAAADPVAPMEGQTGRPMPPVDAIFILGEGAATYFGAGTSLKYRLIGHQEPYEGWAWNDFPSTTLVQMMAWIYASVPRVIRHEAIMTPYLAPSSVEDALQVPGLLPSGQAE